MRLETLVCEGWVGVTCPWTGLADVGFVGPEAAAAPNINHRVIGARQHSLNAQYEVNDYVIDQSMS